MAHVTLSDLFEEITVDLWGVNYEVLQASQQVEEKLAAAISELNAFRRQHTEEFGDTEEDEYHPEAEKKGRDLLTTCIDAVLKGVSDNGDQPPRAKSHLLKLYREKKIGTAQIDVAFDQVMELFGRRNRPTRTSPEESES